MPHEMHNLCTNDSIPCGPEGIGRDVIPVTEFTALPATANDIHRGRPALINTQFPQYTAARTVGLNRRESGGIATMSACAYSLTSRNWTPIDRALVKWRANPPARRGVGRLTVVCPRASCLSFCWLRIGRQCAPDTHLDQVRTHRPRQGATASALSSFEPQKVLGTRRRSREITFRKGSP